jgi:RNA polymerase sigma-70 factor (ECF subfamily)
MMHSNVSLVVGELSMSPQSESFAPLSSAALIDRCRDCDELAFTELFQRHRQMVYRVCLRYLGHHHDAEDITQETFRRAALALPHVDARRPLEPWLVTIAANRCRTFLSRRHLDRVMVPFDESTLPAFHAGDSRRDPEQRLATNEQLEIALARLPAQQRQAFEFVHRNQLTYPEAAQRMGFPTGTIKTWVRRAKQSMQRSLRHDEAVPDIIDTESSATNRGLVAGALASLCWLTWLVFSTQQAAVTPSVDSSPSIVIAATQQKPNSAPELRAVMVDWQWESLDAFSRIRLNAAEIEALPVVEWVSQTTPTLDHLRSGFTPIGSALQRAAQLFQGELASIDAMPKTSLNGATSDQPPVETLPLDEFIQDASSAPATFAAVI